MFREGVTPRLVFEKAEREYNGLKSRGEQTAENAKTHRSSELDHSTTRFRREISLKNQARRYAFAEHRLLALKRLTSLSVSV